MHSEFNNLNVAPIVGVERRDNMAICLPQIFVKK
jgi:hypothetical protein